MRLLICGDREWVNQGVIRAVLRELRPVVVIQGEARGADTIARDEAEALGIRILRFPANWSRYGRAAGVLRNQQMLEQSRLTHLLAFHEDLTQSRGTADMVRRAREAGIPVGVITGPDDPVEFHRAGFFDLTACVEKA